MVLLTSKFQSRLLATVPFTCNSSPLLAMGAPETTQRGLKEAYKPPYTGKVALTSVGSVWSTELSIQTLRTQSRTSSRESSSGRYWCGGRESGKRTAVAAAKSLFSKSPASPSSMASVKST